MEGGRMEGVRKQRKPRYGYGYGSASGAGANVLSDHTDFNIFCDGDCSGFGIGSASGYDSHNGYGHGRGSASGKGCYAIDCGVNPNDSNGEGY